MNIQIQISLYINNYIYIYPYWNITSYMDCISYSSHLLTGMHPHVPLGNGIFFDFFMEHGCIWPNLPFDDVNVRWFPGRQTLELCPNTRGIQIVYLPRKYCKSTTIQVLHTTGFTYVRHIATCWAFSRSVTVTETMFHWSRWPIGLGGLRGELPMIAMYLLKSKYQLWVA